MLNSDLWEAANGVLAILGAFLVLVVVIYLARNIRRTYHDPIRFITLSIAMIVLGHTIKDSASYLSRCCDVTSPSGVIVTAIAFVALGKIGCIKVWSDPDWGNWPWIIAVALVAAFLAVSAIA